MPDLRHLVTLDDMSPSEVMGLLRLASRLKTERNNGMTRSDLEGRSLAMIFEKPSLRTRVTFEVGMTQLGGHAVYLAPADIQVGKRESAADVARNLSRWVDGIMARTFSHDVITGLAEHATVPVINALSDYTHPCQALAFGQLVLEARGDLAGANVVFVGDGNNVAHSIMLLAVMTGMSFTLACPVGYGPDEALVRKCIDLGGEVEVVHDPVAAVESADFIYTDVWASMGQEEESAVRKQAFEAFQVNEALLRSAPSAAIVTHCLPAHRGEEITDGVLDGPNSRAFDEAENRLHAQKAVLLALLAGHPLEG